METQLTNIAAGRIIFEQSCLSWTRKSVKRKKLIRYFINKFVVGDFGFINEVDEMQNNFILKQNFRCCLDLTGKYPLNDNSGYISIKSKENNEYKLETRILFKPYSVLPEPKLIRIGNVIKFDFTR